MYQKKLSDQPIKMTISAVAFNLGVSQRTLRIYDKEGVLPSKRTIKNRRYYTLEDLERAKLIQILTCNFALNLSGVKLFFAVLEKHKIKPKNYESYLNELSQIANITPELQKINIDKNKNKGRKPTHKKT